MILNIDAGYKNNSKSLDELATKITTSISENLILKEKIKVKKEQIIFVDSEQKKAEKEYRVHITQIKSSSKCPHTRRAGIRKLKIYDNDGNVIGYKSVPYKSCIIHKEQYNDTTSKIVK